MESFGVDRTILDGFWIEPGKILESCWVLDSFWGIPGTGHLFENSRGLSQSPHLSHEERVELPGASGTSKGLFHDNG